MSEMASLLDERKRLDSADAAMRLGGGGGEGGRKHRVMVNAEVKAR